MKSVKKAPTKKAPTKKAPRKKTPTKKAPRKKTPTKKAPRKSAKARKSAKEFELLSEKFKEKKPIHYSMSGSFEKNDLIDHDTFGRGIVIGTSYQRIEVLFPDRSRTLVCDS